MSKHVLLVALLSIAGLAFQGCGMVQPAPQDLLTKKDHRGLADYYKDQAQELRDKAKTWDVLAESYEMHGDPHGKVEPKDHAAHCRAIASSYRKAAEEADVLAREHQQQLPHGVVR
jgi:hypothetical protein